MRVVKAAMAAAVVALAVAGCSSTGTPVPSRVSGSPAAAVEQACPQHDPAVAVGACERRSPGVRACV